MSFKILFGDICYMKSDAIVNSLGVDSKYLGQVCKSIASNAYSDEVNKVVYSKDTNNLFDIFVTGAGMLKAKHIIHIVSPYKHLDDENNSMLKKAYRLVIEEAIKIGCKSISVPFLGTGANGYKRSDVFESATSVAKEYLSDSDEDFDELININLILYNKEGMELEMLEKERSYRIRQIEIDSQDDISIDGAVNTAKTPKHILDSVKMNKIFYDAKMSEMFVPNDYVTCVMDFIDSYIRQNKIKKKDFYEGGFDKDHCSKCRTGKRVFPKHHIYRAGIILGWNKTNFLQAMSFAGFSFSPLDQRDAIFYDYLKNNKLIKNINIVLELYPQMTYVLYDNVKKY